MDEITAPWYSVDWFMASTWRGFTWENPVFLYLLAAVPFLFLTRWLVRYYFNQKLPVALIKSDVKTKIKNSPLPHGYDLCPKPFLQLL